MTTSISSKYCLEEVILLMVKKQNLCICGVKLIFSVRLEKTRFY